MKRSLMLQILAKRLSGRDVEDIRSYALLEMKLVQQAVLERLPNQPWFLETEEIFPVLKGEKGWMELPPDYNGIMTHGGVWLANEATVLKESFLTSKLYAVEVEEQMHISNAEITGLDYRTNKFEISSDPESLDLSFSVTAVELRETLKTYETEVESLDVSFAVTAVELRANKFETEMDTESLDIAFAVTGVELRGNLIKYVAPNEDTLGVIAMSVTGVSLV